MISSNNLFFKAIIINNEKLFKDYNYAILNKKDVINSRTIEGS